MFRQAGFDPLESRLPVAVPQHIGCAQLPAIERKQILWDVVKPAEGIIQYSQHVEGGGAESSPVLHGPRSMRPVD